MIQDFKNNKKLEPYFLAVVKTKIEFQQASILSLLEQHNPKKILQCALSYEDALIEIRAELDKIGLIKEHQKVVIHDVCQHYYVLKGKDEILKGTPELLIIKEHSNN